MKQEKPLVGVAVVVLRDGRILLGKRLGAHGAGTWALPGGHLEFGESIEECAVREVLEETGLDVRPLRRGPYTSDIFPAEGKHYITLFVEARCDSGRPRIMEPDRCAGWQWFHWSDLPQPLFPPLASLRQSGFVPGRDLPE